MAVPRGWFGYWGEDIFKIMGGSAEQMKEFDILIMADRQIDLSPEFFERPPEGFGFIQIFAATLPPSEAEKPEEEWSEDFYENMGDASKDNRTGQINFAGKKGYYIAGILEDNEGNKTNSDMVVVATRYQGRAFAFVGVITKDQGINALAYFTEILETVTFK
jgi:hypothetical protein